MNKAKIDKLLPYAYEAIKEAKIPDEKGRVDKAFRGQISTFGASVTMGSLLAAIAFFIKPNDSSTKVNRSYLLDAIFIVLKRDGEDGIRENNKNINSKNEISDKGKELFKWAQGEVKNGNESSCREKIINASIAIKLAINLYPLTESAR